MYAALGSKASVGKLHTDLVRLAIVHLAYCEKNETHVTCKSYGTFHKNTKDLVHASDGTGISGLGITSLGTASVNVSGAVYNAAVAATITPANPIVLANQRVGGSLSQALTISNSAPSGAFTERLNASFGAIGGNALTNGVSVSLLAAGASSNAMVVGVDTSVPGTRSGTALVNFQTDGNGTSGLAAVSAGSQSVTVQGDVFRLASPVLNTLSATLFARVGDAAPSAAISVTNTSPDAFTERLNAAFTGAPAGFGTSPGFSGLIAGASSNALAITLSTAAAGQHSGPASIQFVSSGAGTTGAPDANAGTASVSLTERVYTPAVLQVNTPLVNFGIVHTGDSVAARNVSVTNAAPLAAPNDELRGSLGGAAGPFAASGALAGLAAQATDASSLSVSLNIASAGAFTGTATLSAASHNRTWRH